MNERTNRLLNMENKLVKWEVGEGMGIIGKGD